MVVVYQFRIVRGIYYNGFYLNYFYNYDICYIGMNSLDIVWCYRLFGLFDILQKRSLYYFDKGINEYV